VSARRQMSRLSNIIPWGARTCIAPARMRRRGPPPSLWLQSTQFPPGCMHWRTRTAQS
jgi:hypothetical protein